MTLEIRSLYIEWLLLHMTASVRGGNRQRFEMFRNEFENLLEDRGIHVNESYKEKYKGICYDAKVLYQNRKV